jgi:integrase
VSTPSAQQLVLFERGPDFARLREAEQKLLAACRAPSTLRAYAYAWRYFESWAREAGRTTLPAAADTLSLYITSLLENRELRLNTIRLRLSSIRIRHHDAGLECAGKQRALALIRNACRQRRESPGGKRALTPGELYRIGSFLRTSTALLDVRDRAVVVFGFALGWRSAELASLDLADVRLVRDGVRVRLGYSKTDQQGKGREVGIPYGRQIETCPVRALEEWIRVRGSWEGPLFAPLAQRLRHRHRAPAARTYRRDRPVAHWLALLAGGHDHRLCREWRGAGRDHAAQRPSRRQDGDRLYPAGTGLSRGSARRGAVRIHPLPRRKRKATRETRQDESPRPS